MKKFATVDFETEGIQSRPAYPPKPVGVAITVPGHKPKYYAWGHPLKNNCTFEQAAYALKQVCKTSTIAFHNSKFDQDVAREHFSIPLPPAEDTHDSMLLAYLDDPYNHNLSLKPLAERELGEPPTEQDELKEWVTTHVPEARQKPSSWGAYICKAPADLVGRYAIGDVTRTAGLVKKLYPKIVAEGMEEAYLRERKIIPVLLETERYGIHVDTKRLREDIVLYGHALEKCAAYVRKRLKSPDLDIAQREELARAIERAGLAEGGWLLTPKGKNSTSKDSIDHALSDRMLVCALGYWGSLSTCLNNFMIPWLRMAEDGNRIYTQWHSTRGADGYGARTGRLSSTPNFQNIPTEFEAEYALFNKHNFLKKMGLPNLPQVRSYIVADKGQILFGRDYNSQELRGLAYFEDGDLADKYEADPVADIHQFVADMINESFQLGISRKTGKTLNFLKVYGGGAGKLAAKLGITVELSQKIMKAYMSVFPGLKDLNSEMQRRDKMHEPIRTLGGRRYYAEEPRIIDGKLQRYGYKLLNYLVQGSSADMTKEAMIRYSASKHEDSQILMSVHDEIVCTCPKALWKPEMAKLKTAMESIDLGRVPLLSDGEVGNCWTEMKDCV